MSKHKSILTVDQLQELLKKNLTVKDFVIELEKLGVKNIYRPGYITTADLDYQRVNIETEDNDTNECALVINAYCG